ncbi:hypothetical protein JX265_007604 [Neoarthrinium moseri]|uniref:PPM-type phosphatase domain-containing protein n=1 Tax=Neoarthrinium moseri TaxID=1658444 RepID=A0A9Q0ANG8_9PEZI|nr:hypothetical protein JX265_007604 [Neoarthrinium moseri]
MWSQRVLRRPSRLAANVISHARVPRPRLSSSTSSRPRGGKPTILVLGTFAAGSLGTLAYQKATTPNTERGTPPAPAAPKTTNTEVPDLDNLASSNKVDLPPAISAEDVTQELNAGAFSFHVADKNGVDKYDGAQVASNSPCEDAYVHGRFSNPLQAGGAADWMAWGVFDGHCGWQTSNLLTRQLLPYVQRTLHDLTPDSGVVSDEAIQGAIAAAFRELDDALVKGAKDVIESDLSYPEKIRRLQPAYAGSCALLTLYDPSTSSLHVASTGDCRAVLGRKTADGKWEAVALTKDQTGANEDEIARIREQFPDEPEIVKGGRIWGLEPSRTFGDGGWKWDKELRSRLRREFNACKFPNEARYKDYKTGPYVTASPVVSTIKVPRDGSSTFLILATDGLWDTMGNQQAVDLVGRWSDLQSAPGKPPAPVLSLVSGEPVKFGRTGCWHGDHRATFQDSNAAVHLIRNGLGGAHDEMVRGAMSFQSNLSRDIRDDMTVQVVFFQGTDKS